MEKPAASSLTLKNVPPELIQHLREAAQEERRSVNQQSLHLLLEALSARKRAGGAQTARASGQLAAWRALSGTWRSDEDTAAEVKRIYSRRTRGRKADL